MSIQDAFPPHGKRVRFIPFTDCRHRKISGVLCPEPVTIRILSAGMMNFRRAVRHVENQHRKRMTRQGERRTIQFGILTY